MILLAKIKSLEDISSLTKQQKIVKGVKDCLIDADLAHGDILPSVNELSSKLGYSRETVVKAYKLLKEKGLVNSKHGLGYFISKNDGEQELSIALVLYGYQTFQQNFYNRFRKQLGDKYQIDVFFHHNNMDMYQSILSNIKSQYGLYVVAPIQSNQAQEMLIDFPSDKLLIIDRYQYINDDVAHITQEFEISLSLVFEELEQRIMEFDRLILFYRDDVDYPSGIYNSFKMYCKSKNVNLEVYKEYDIKYLKKNSLYFTIGDNDLWSILRDAKLQGLKIGDDVGILSHNDSLVKEIIEGGITTFSTDFNLMADKSAEYILDRRNIKEIIPCKLIRRNSL